MTWSAERVTLMLKLYEEYRANPVWGWRKELADRLGLRETQVIAKLGRAYRSGKLKPIGGWFGPRAPRPEVPALPEPEEEPIVCEPPPKLKVQVRPPAPPPAPKCQFPLWPNGFRPPRDPPYCDKPALPGKSWCVECYAKLFTKAKQLNLYGAVPP